MKHKESSIGRFFGNRWVKFSIASLLWILIFVVWSENWWMLIGLLFIFDIYISKYMYKLFWKKHKEHKQRSRLYREVWGWIEAIVFAVVVASLIHIYVFQMYQIPTSSMEKTLLVGDYLCVSKVAYGPRMPNTPVAFPLVHNTMPLSKTKKSYCESVKWPYHRLRGLGGIKRNDIVVFNFPAGDTVLLENQAVTYYDVVRDYQSAYGDKRGREMLNKQYTVISRPVDKREHYVKRAVAVAGDTIEVVHSQVYINGQKQIEIPNRQYVYFVATSGTPISRSAFEKMGIANSDIAYDRQNGIYTLPLTDQNVEYLKTMKNVLSIEKYESTESYAAVFPNEGSFGWTEDNFGPLWIPYSGATVELTLDNLPLYRRIIDVYEQNDLEVRDGVIYINSSPADSYTFKQDYYFMMGDNRHNSADSRFWGFVPQDHIVGKPSFVWLSLDKDRKFPANIRWNRMFRNMK